MGIRRQIVRYNYQHEVDLIQVMIVAPAIAIRAGLSALLGDDPSIQVIAEGASLADIDHLQLESDVVIWSPAPYMDPEMVHLEISKVNIGETSALLLIYNGQYIIDQLSRLRVRAWGVIDPESTQSELVASIHALNEGLVVANPIWLKRAITDDVRSAKEDSDLVEALTEREVEILQLLAYGLTNKQIAARLKISAHTVKFHVSTIFNKMGTTNRVETVNLGLKKGLIVL